MSLTLISSVVGGQYLETSLYAAKAFYSDKVSTETRQLFAENLKKKGEEAYEYIGYHYIVDFLNRHPLLAPKVVTIASIFARTMQAAGCFVAFSMAGTLGGLSATAILVGRVVILTPIITKAILEFKNKGASIDKFLSECLRLATAVNLIVIFSVSLNFISYFGSILIFIQTVRQIINKPNVQTCVDYFNSYAYFQQTEETYTQRISSFSQSDASLYINEIRTEHYVKTPNDAKTYAQNVLVKIYDAFIKKWLTPLMGKCDELNKCNDANSFIKKFKEFQINFQSLISIMQDKTSIDLYRDLHKQAPAKLFRPHFKNEVEALTKHLATVDETRKEMVKSAQETVEKLQKEIDKRIDDGQPIEKLDQEFADALLKLVFLLDPNENGFNTHNFLKAITTLRYSNEPAGLVFQTTILQIQSACKDHDIENLFPDFCKADEERLTALEKMFGEMTKKLKEYSEKNKQDKQEK